MANLSRRNFMTALTSGLMGLGLTRNVKGSPGLDPEATEPLKIKKYNPLGKTGLKVADVSCGAISFFEPNVMRYAYDCGVNYFDTAEGYLRTKSESFIGQALSDIRDKVIITTKHAYREAENLRRDEIFKRMEASLKRLKSDYVDIAMVHGLSDLALLKNEELLAAYSQLKKEGKVRFTGFSTHNAPLTLKQALEEDFAQVVLFIYNHMEGQEIEPLIKKLHQKGIGTVAMKIFAGGKHGSLKSLIGKEASYPQAAIRWVQSNPDIDCMITTMSSYSHVEEYVAASGKPLNRKDLEVIAAYQREAHSEYCRVSCSQCLASCPKGVAINDVLRFKMYYEDYRMEKEALLNYAALEEGKKPLSCASCSGYCESACPYRIKIKDKLIQAHDILST